MEIRKTDIRELKIMEKKGFEDLIPYIHKNPLVRWVFWKRLQILLSMLPRGERVLDFGAGSGVLEPSLLEGFEKVYALDLNTDSLRHIKEKENIKNLDIFSGNYKKLPFQDNFFDAIIAADVLEHISNRLGVLREFKRVLKSRGVLLISGPTENKIYKISRRLIFWFWKKKEDHFTNINEIIKEAISLFKKDRVISIPSKFICGFKICKFIK